jgi:hypothetical protein
MNKRICISMVGKEDAKLPYLNPQSKVPNMPVVTQQFDNFSAFYGIPSIIIVFTIMYPESVELESTL